MAIGPVYGSWLAAARARGVDVDPVLHNVQRWKTMPRGGHSAALEEPVLLADDLRQFFRPMR